MPEEKDYISKVYSSLKENGEGFTIDETSFRDKISKNPEYADKVYSHLKSIGGESFTLPQQDFYSRLKKKGEEVSTTTAPKSSSAPTNFLDQFASIPIFGQAVKEKLPSDSSTSESAPIKSESTKTGLPTEYGVTVTDSSPTSTESKPVVGTGGKKDVSVDINKSQGVGIQISPEKMEVAFPTAESENIARRKAFVAERDARLKLQAEETKSDYLQNNEEYNNIAKRISEANGILNNPLSDNLQKQYVQSQLEEMAPEVQQVEAKKQEYDNVINSFKENLQKTVDVVRDFENKSSYAGGAAKSFLEGTADILDAAQGANNFLSKYLFGHTVEGDGLYQMAGKWTRESGDDNFRNMPEGYGGQILRGVAGTIPLILEMMPTGGLGAAALPMVMAGNNFGKEYLKSKDVGSSLKEGVKGGAEGIIFHGLGLGANTIGKYVGGVLGNAVKSKGVSVVTEGLTGLMAAGAGFGGYDYAVQFAEGVKRNYEKNGGDVKKAMASASEEVDMNSVIANASIGIGLGAPNAAKAIYAHAANQFLTSDKAVLDNAMAVDKPIEELRDKSMEFIEAYAKAKTPSERSQLIMALNAVSGAANRKSIGIDIINNKERYITDIKTSGKEADEISLLEEKVNEFVKRNDPRIAEAMPSEDALSAINEQLKDVDPDVGDIANRLKNEKLMASQAELTKKIEDIYNRPLTEKDFLSEEGKAKLEAEEKEETEVETLDLSVTTDGAGNKYYWQKKNGKDVSITKAEYDNLKAAELTKAEHKIEPKQSNPVSKVGKVGNSVGGDKSALEKDFSHEFDDKPLVDVINELPGISAKEAGTGTIYIENKETGERVRVGNHEPNYNAPRSTDYTEVYTHDASGKEINKPHQVIERVSEILGIELPDNLKDFIDKKTKQEDLYRQRAEVAKKEHDAFIQKVQEKKSEHIPFVEKNKNELAKIEQDAEKYSEEATNGDKRRKRRKSYFKEQVKKQFDYDLEYSDYKDILAKSESLLKEQPTEPIQSEIEQNTPVSKVVGEVGNSVGGDVEFKAKSDKHFDYVPIEEVDKYKEFDRETEKKFDKKELDDLTEDIKKNGIKTPIKIQVDRNGKALIVEGNTRLAAAKRLGIKNIPVEIVEGEFGSINKDKATQLPDVGRSELQRRQQTELNLKDINGAYSKGFTRVEPKSEPTQEVSVGGDKSALSETDDPLQKVKNFIDKKTLSRQVTDVIINGKYENVPFYEWLISIKKNGGDIVLEKNLSTRNFEYKAKNEDGANLKTPKITKGIKEWFDNIENTKIKESLLKEQPTESIQSEIGDAELQKLSEDRDASEKEYVPPKEKVKNIQALPDADYVKAFIDSGQMNATGQVHDMRVDFGMSTKDVSRAIKNIREGKDSAVARELTKKILDTKKTGEVPFILGTGGMTERPSILVQDLREHIISAAPEPSADPVEEIVNHEGGKYEIVRDDNGSIYDVLGENGESVSDNNKLFNKVSKIADVKKQGAAGVSKAIGESEMADAGKVLEKVDARRWKGVIEEADKLVKSGEVDPNILLKEVEKSHRTLSDTEVAVLVKHKAELKNKYDGILKEINDAPEGENISLSILRQDILEKEFEKIEQVFHDVIRPSAGRSLAALNMIMRKDYSPLNVISRGKSAESGGVIPEKVREIYDRNSKEIAEQRKEIEELTKKSSDLYRKYESLLKRTDLNKAIRRQKILADAEVRKTGREQSKEEIQKSLDSSLERLKILSKEQRGTLSANPISVEMLVEIGKVAKDYIKLGTVEVAQIIDNIYLAMGEAYSKDDIEAAISEAIVSEAQRDATELKDVIPELSEEASAEEIYSKFKLGLDRTIDDIKKTERNKDTASKKIREIEKANDHMKKFWKDAKKAQQESDRAKRIIDRTIKERKDKSKSRFEKGLLFAGKLYKAAILTGYRTPIKLGAAVANIVLLKPSYAGIAGILSRTPGLRDIYKKAPMQRIGLGALGKFFTTTLAKETFKESYNELMGKGTFGRTVEGAKYDDSGILNVPGRFHSAIKVFAKLPVYEAAKYEMVKDYLERGEDPFNSVNAATIETLAVTEADNAIMMDDHFLAASWNKLVMGLQESENDAIKALATFMAIEDPIVKVPLNQAAAVLEHVPVIGLLHRIGQIKKGTSKEGGLTPKDANSLARNITRQGLGLAIAGIATYYYKQFGGYQYWKSKDDKDIGIKEMNIKIGEYEAPKILLHNAAYGTADVFATIAREANEGNGVVAGVGKAFSGLAEEDIPFIRSAGNTEKMVDMLKSGRFSTAAGNFIGKLISTPDMRKLSQVIDDERKTNPQGFWEAVANDLPGLRKYVSGKEDVEFAKWYLDQQDKEGNFYKDVIKLTKKEADKMGDRKNTKKRDEYILAHPRKAREAGMKTSIEEEQYYKDADAKTIRRQKWIKDNGLMQ